MPSKTFPTIRKRNEKCPEAAVCKHLKQTQVKHFLRKLPCSQDSRIVRWLKQGNQYTDWTLNRSSKSIILLHVKLFLRTAIIPKPDPDILNPCWILDFYLLRIADPNSYETFPTKIKQEPGGLSSEIHMNHTPSGRRVSILPRETFSTKSGKVPVTPPPCRNSP